MRSSRRAKALVVCADADRLVVALASRELPPPPLFSGSFVRRVSAFTALGSLLLPHAALAEPKGGNVVSGAASISQSGPVTDINQTTGKAIINWQGFSVAPQETVNFHQPDASSVTLNRVIGNESSIIQGALNANGQIFLVNSNGILFSDAARVNVGGLVASTLDISDDDFLAGNYSFAGSSTASVVNKGALSATQGGYVSLLGKTVSNQGIISATLGTVALASGSKATLNFGGNSLVDVTIDKGVFNALVENKQLIKADGGQVIMTARAADAILSAQVNNTGIVQARTMAGLTGGVKKGRIELNARGGKTTVSGKLDASAPNGGDGGFIATSGDTLKVEDAAIVTTKAAHGANGSWLIDPTDFTIYGGSGDATASGIGAATLQRNLKSGDITIVTSASGADDGDINVNASLDWSENILTLAAHGDINVNGTVTWTRESDAGPQTGLVLTAGKNIFVNNVMTMTGPALFAANYGHLIAANGTASGTATAGSNVDGTPYGLYTSFGPLGTFAGKIDIAGAANVFLNGEEHVVIGDAASLLDARSDAESYRKNYVLGSNVNFTTTNLWTSGLGTGTAFEGSFNGLGHVVTMAAVTRNTPTDGLFAATSATASISNVGISGNIRTLATGGRLLGALADVNAGSIVNSFSTATVYGINVGGLVGNNSGLIANSYQSGAVSNLYTNAGSSEPTHAGGIAAINSGAIKNSFVTQSSVGAASANGNAGNVGLHIAGFVGSNSGLIDNSYAVANVVTGNNNKAVAGGFAGSNSGTITNSYAGQLAFNLPNGLPVTVGSVTGRDNDIFVGGFVGENANGGSIVDSYAALSTSVNFIGSVAIGGFSGQNAGTISNAFYDQGLTGLSTDHGGATGLLANQAKQLSNYGTLASSAYWGSSADGHPVLATLPVYVSLVTGETLSYGTKDSALVNSIQAFGLQWSDTKSLLQYVVSDASLLSGSGYLNAGGYNAASVIGSDIYKNIAGGITVAPLALTFAADGLVVGKVYDGTTAATVNVTAANNGLIGLLGSESFEVIYSGATFADKNVGNNKTVVVTAALGAGSNGASAGNYTIAASATTKADITPATLSASYAVNDKVYDGSAAATISVSGITGVIAGDAVTISAGGQFSSANAGSNRSATITAGLSGQDAGNYTLATPSAGKANITPRPLNLVATQPKGGSLYIPASNITVANLVAGDSVQLKGQGFITGTTPGTYDMSLAALTASGNTNYTMNGATGLAIIYQAPLPVGPTVVSGSNVTVATNGKVMTVGQNSNKAIINWESFDIGTGYSVAFNQPSSKAVTLNRVIGNEESIIAGSMTAPGHVYLVNSAGILFTNSSQVNVGALVASTQNMTNTDFLNGTYSFGTNAATGWVEAHGNITVSEGGYVGLIGHGVANQGSIQASGGKVVLAGGSGVALSLDADGRLADYSIATADQWVAVGGTIDVSSAASNGGMIETAGYVSLDPHLVVAATGATGFSDGLWQMKAPGDFNIASGANISGADLTRLLGSLDVNVRSATGNVNVKDAVSWSANTLRLISPNDINVSNVMTATDSASLFASYGITSYVRHLSGGLLGVTQPVRDYTLHGINMAYATNSAGKPTNAFKGKIDFQSSGSLVMGSTGNEATYTVLNSVGDLLAINDSTANFANGQRYALGRDMNLGGIANWTPLGLIGGSTVSFDGVFNGLGHTVSNLTSSNNGLFAHVGRAQFDEGGASASDPTVAFGVVPEFAGVSNVGVVNVNIDCTADCATGGSYSIGGLAGYSEGQMTNVFSTGKINARYTGSSSTQNSAGGLYGSFSGYANNNYSTVDLTTSGFAYVGGLAGEGGSGYIGKSHASGDIVFDSLGRTKAYVGGFVGYSHGTTIIASSASGNVSGKGGYVGGFAGYVEMGTLISNSTATGNVYLNDSVYARDDAAGGFVGMIYDGSVAFSSSSGRVQSALGDYTYVGGFSGMVVSGLHGMAVGNFWNVETSGISTNGGGNYEPDHGPGEGTPIVDAYNAQYGTNLTPGQFHGGAVGVNSADSATLQQQSGDPAALAKSTESIMNGGSPIPAGGGTGSGTGNGNGGSTPVAPTRPTRSPAAGATPQQYFSSIGSAAVSATVGIEKAREDKVTPSDAKAGVAQTTAQSAPKLDDTIDLSKAPPSVTKVSDDDQRRRKKVNRAAPAAGADYGAQIKSIDVDGQRFDLEKKNESPAGGETAAPPADASGAAP